MTDNPSGSTGQNVTAPANAPAGSDSSERDDLAHMIYRAREWAADPDMVKLLADQCIAAGFTRRAQHDGERVARLTEQRDALCADHLAALRKLDAAIRERDEARAVLNLYANAADRAFQGRDAVLPDFVRLGGCKAEGIVTLAEAYRALRDEHDAAIARADAASERAAQAENQMWYVKGVTWQQQAVHNHQRAAALAEALRVVADGSQLALDHPKWRLSEQACDLIRAALAGNGTTAKAKPRTGRCAEKRKPGGCQLHNLHCDYPKCDEYPDEPAANATDAPPSGNGNGTEEGA